MVWLVRKRRATKGGRRGTLSFVSARASIPYWVAAIVVAGAGSAAYARIAPGVDATTYVALGAAFAVVFGVVHLALWATLRSLETRALWGSLALSNNPTLSSLAGLNSLNKGESISSGFSAVPGRSCLAPPSP